MPADYRPNLDHPAGPLCSRQGCPQYSESYTPGQVTPSRRCALGGRPWEEAHICAPWAKDALTTLREIDEAGDVSVHVRLVGGGL